METTILIASAALLLGSIIGYIAGVYKGNDNFNHIASELTDTHMENLKLKEDLATAEWQLGNYKANC